MYDFNIPKISKNRKYHVRPTKLFLKQLKSYKRDRNKLTKLYYVIDTLAAGESLPPKYCDHKLEGCKYRECHVEPDFLLIYQIYKDELTLVLYQVGSHAKLFNCLNISTSNFL